LTLLKCLPPSNFVLKKAKILLITVFLEVSLAPIQITFALLCCLDNLDATTEVIKADLTFLNRFEAIDIPIPEPHIKIPKVVESIFLQSFLAKTG
jgi:hypothetical protein